MTPKIVEQRNNGLHLSGAHLFLFLSGEKRQEASKLGAVKNAGWQYASRFSSRCLIPRQSFKGRNGRSRWRQLESITCCACCAARLMQSRYSLHLTAWAKPLHMSALPGALGLAGSRTLPHAAIASHRCWPPPPHVQVPAASMLTQGTKRRSLLRWPQPDSLPAAAA